VLKCPNTVSISSSGETSGMAFPVKDSLSGVPWQAAERI